jgi:sugar lactone lactonase YvrE
MEEFVAKPCTTDRYYLGECCRWDDVRSELYWIDIPTGRFFRAHADSAQIDIVHSYDLGGNLTAVAPLQNRKDGWIVALDRSIFFLDEEGEMRELARPEGHNAPGVRMNDGAADPWGRFWVGSMALRTKDAQGSLYRFHESSGTELMLSEVTISNGLGWSPDRRTMYYVDSGPGTICTFDVDKNGEISGKQLFCQFNTEDDGRPDGLCVDSDGAIWVAIWGAYEVRRFSPSGELLARVKLSTVQPSSCAIGGANGTTLYITTARENLAQETLDMEPDAGLLFCVDVNVTGLPIDPYRSSGLTRR